MRSCVTSCINHPGRETMQHFTGWCRTAGSGHRQDALSRKPHKKLRPKNAHLQKEMAQLNVHIIPQGSHRKLSIQPTLKEEIRKVQGSDRDLMKIRKHTGENKAPDFRVDDKGTLWYKNRICVPKEGKFRHIIMDEAHYSAYSIHPGATTML